MDPTYNEGTVLSLVKCRLNRMQSDATQDDYLLARIEAAAGGLKKNGIALDGSMEDTMLLVDLTVWQYQNRDKGEAMPQWLRLRRRERWLHDDS